MLHRERSTPSSIMRMREWQQQQIQHQISPQMGAGEEQPIGLIQTVDDQTPAAVANQGDVAYLSSGGYTDSDSQPFPAEQQPHSAPFSLSEPPVGFPPDQIMRQAAQPQFSSTSSTPGNVEELKTTLHDYEIELASLRAMNKQLTAENRHLRDVVASYTAQYAQYAQLDQVRLMDKEELCVRLVNATSTVQSLNALLQSCYTQLLRLKRRKDDFIELERVVREQGSMLSYLREETSRIPYLEDALIHQSSVPLAGIPQHQPQQPQPPRQPQQHYASYGVLPSQQPDSMTTPFVSPPVIRDQEFAIPYPATASNSAMRQTPAMYQTVSYSSTQMAQNRSQQRPNFPIAPRPHSGDRWDESSVRLPLTPQPQQPLSHNRNPSQPSNPIYFASTTAPASPIYASSMW